MKKIFTALLLVCCLTASAAEVIPPPPKQYFNDYAHAVAPATAARLNQTLEDFERETSSQIVVAVFPKMQSASSIEDYTFRVKESWKVGQKGKDNGAVLFVFIQDRKMFLQVNYGLEGALPDALCKRIIEDEIKPHFKSGDFDGGLRAGVSAILAATKGEYKGSGQTQADHGLAGGAQSPWAALLPFLFVGGFVVILLLLAIRRSGRGRHYSGSGWSSTGWSSGGGGWSSGGGGFSNGGGFSGGGGTGGGGGAGGSW